MICHIIVLHQSTVLCKEEGDVRREEDVRISVHFNCEILSCTKHYKLSIIIKSFMFFNKNTINYVNRHPGVEIDQGVVVPEEGGVVVIKDQIDKK